MGHDKMKATSVAFGVKQDGDFSIHFQPVASINNLFWQFALNQNATYQRQHELKMNPKKRVEESDWMRRFWAQLSTTNSVVSYWEDVYIDEINPLTPNIKEKILLSCALLFL